MNVAEEAAWLAEARLGDPAALARLYDMYARPMYTLCHRVLGNDDDAQDSMQAAFVKAFRSIGAFIGLAPIEYLTDAERAREEALEALRVSASALGADAVIKIQFDAVEDEGGITAVVASGEAVRLQ